MRLHTIQASTSMVMLLIMFRRSMSAGTGVSQAEAVPLASAGMADAALSCGPVRRGRCRTGVTAILAPRSVVHAIATAAIMPCLLYHPTHDASQPVELLSDLLLAERLYKLRLLQKGIDVLLLLRRDPLRKKLDVAVLAFHLKKDVG